MPTDAARELVYSARIVSGIQARGLGLVTHVDDGPRAASLVLARESATRSPDAVLAGERVLGAMAHSPRRALWLENAGSSSCSRVTTAVSP